MTLLATEKTTTFKAYESTTILSLKLTRMRLQYALSTSYYQHRALGQVLRGAEQYIDMTNFPRLNSKAVILTAYCKQLVEWLDAEIAWLEQSARGFIGSPFKSVQLSYAVLGSYGKLLCSHLYTECCTSMTVLNRGNSNSSPLLYSYRWLAIAKEWAIRSQVGFAWLTSGFFMASADERLKDAGLPALTEPSQIEAHQFVKGHGIPNMRFVKRFVEPVPLDFVESLGYSVCPNKIFWLGDEWEVGNHNDSSYWFDFSHWNNRSLF